MVIEALFGTAEAFFRPAYTGLVPRTVPRSEIQEAQALSNLTFNLAELTGPALATALVLGVGRRLGVPARRRDLRGERAVPGPGAHEGRAAGAASERGTLLAELAEGFQEVRSRSWLWVTVVVFALAIPLGYAPLFVLGPTLAEDGYDTAGGLRHPHRRVRRGRAGRGARVGLRWRPRTRCARRSWSSPHGR